MTPVERMTADYAGTSLTIGPHPMSMRRHDLAMRGVQRAIDLPRGRNGHRVRTAGMVITRQRPGTAKGFVFLTLEDETGIANVIVRPDLFAAERSTLVSVPFLLVEGILQNIDGVTSGEGRARGAARRIAGGGLARLPLSSRGPGRPAHDRVHPFGLCRGRAWVGRSGGGGERTRRPSRRRLDGLAGNLQLGHRPRGEQPAAALRDEARDLHGALVPGRVRGDPGVRVHLAVELRDQHEREGIGILPG
jgi:hypothetical protein